MYRWETTRAALAQRVFATIRTESYDQAAATADTLLSAGLTTLEISLTTPFALEAVTTLVREVGDDAVIGAGTVLDEVSARMAIEAGARFLLAPNLDEAVLRTGHRYGIPVFPGVATPTEAVRAMELGADALTLYPATAYTPDWVVDLRAIIPHVALLPIGGITVTAAPDWVAA
ncbi:bifunctional 4-hydroxy-2-oxoglutarate aldolase/2-dehydro-3-deoxy-phosphogluconate aldolase, partial [Actinacidiphila rubida]